MAGNMVAPQHRGHVWEGYTATPQAGIIADSTMVMLIAQLMRSRSKPVRWEAARWLAITAADRPEAARALAAAADAAEDPIELEHMLIAFSRLPPQHRKPHTDTVARLLVELPYRLDRAAVPRDRHWPYRIRELYEVLARGVPGLHRAVLRQPPFGHPDHVHYVLTSGFPTRDAVEHYYRLWRAGQFSRWTDPLIRLARELDHRRQRVLIDRLWHEAPDLRPELLILLARAPQPTDLPRLIEGLRGYRVDVAKACLKAVQRLGGTPHPEVLPLAIRWWRRCEENDQRDDAAVFAEYVKAHVGDNVASPAAALTAVRRRWPDAVRNTDELNWKHWEARLQRIRWTDGDVRAGEQLFRKLGCVHCHNGASFVGPDLRGVARRFSRTDLFRAILFPDETVPDRYRATRFLLADGRVVVGQVIYESVGVILVHTAEGTDVRIQPEHVERRTEMNGSIMPRGLLQGLSDRELADLYAYLRSL